MVIILNNKDIDFKYGTSTKETVKERIGISEEEYFESGIKALDFLNIDPNSIPISMCYLSDAIEKVKDKLRLNEKITMEDIENVEKEALALWL